MIDLRKYRELKGLSQGDAARFFHCKQSYISQIENGKRPISKEMISIIEADGIDMSLIEVPDEVKPPKQPLNTKEDLLKLLAKKDEQIDRLLAIIEKLTSNE